jgi:DNA-directed RNA polymerase subunit RPC12/RpoP
MRCGHEFVQTWGDRDERMCPKCRSNSVRKLKGKPKPTK